MVSLTRRGVALLAIAACASTALAAEGPAEAAPEVVAEVIDQPAPADVTTTKKGISPVAMGGAAVGAALLMAIGFFGLQVLGAKIVQTESGVAHTKVAEEVLAQTEKFTLATEKYSAFVELTYEDKAREAIKAFNEEEKKAQLERVGADISGFLSNITESGVSTLDLTFGEGKAQLRVDMRLTKETESGEKPESEQPATSE
ncbi:hypothetical protein, conserved [Eimeria brunetti]|uniref:Uncharacterized protein n=1 Tax=Eimeria brunetti TaxID=51314 RepID=U6LNU8_9EIME|nr:hypothetical protein, conserved [Eimeria brunetti]